MGFYARPSAEGVFPGVVMIHEWWGLNENIKETAKQLAGQGYQVLAVDLFGSVATTADEARALVANLDQAKAVENLRAATAYLRGQGSAKIASLGWCFGGAQSVELSVSGEPLDATIVYYGRLINDTERLKNIAWPVLGIFGETDQSIPPSAVNEFQAALTTLGIENDITIYPGVGHAFANPSGDNYAPEETKDAWAKVLAFLEANLKN
jgi:carboxymethylenebutenolidase